MKSDKELLVYQSSREAACVECGAEILVGDLITLKGSDPLCLSCSDLDHLIYLPSGDTALTRRARKHSTLSVVVVQYSKSRKRNERQGVLVSEEGLNRAEQECLSDEDQRAVRRKRDQARAEKRDEKYIQDFAAEINKLFPGCPEETASAIAGHACEKYSGRVGRSAGAKTLDSGYVILAVRAHIRHAETNYDSLLGQGYPREMAREQILGQLEECISQWGKNGV